VKGDVKDYGWRSLREKRSYDRSSILIVPGEPTSSDHPIRFDSPSPKSVDVRVMWSVGSSMLGVY